MRDFQNQLARHVIDQKYKVAKVYVETGNLRGMKPFPPFCRLVRNGRVNEYSVMMSKKASIFNKNWDRRLR